jgi:homoserine kinase type II
MNSARAPEPSELRALLGAWPLEGVGAITPAAGGATNWVYRVEAGSTVAFLEIYRKADRATALREHALIASVRRSAIPAASPLPSRTGETLVEGDGRRCALYEAARGIQLRPGELSIAHAAAAGATLANLHSVTRELPDVDYVRWNLRWDGPAWVDRLDVIERAIVTAGVASETDEWALRRVREQRRWLRDPACAHTCEPAFPGQVIHGDYQHANLFFEGPAVCAIIDWEQAAFMPAAYELVRAASFMFRLDAALTRAFVDAYVARSGISESAIADGAAAWACFYDHHVWALEEAYSNGNDAARQYIPHVPFQPFLRAWNGLR